MFRLAYSWAKKKVEGRSDKSWYIERESLHSGHFCILQSISISFWVSIKVQILFSTAALLTSTKISGIGLLRELGSSNNWVEPYPWESWNRHIKKFVINFLGRVRTEKWENKHQLRSLSVGPVRRSNLTEKKTAQNLTTSLRLDRKTYRITSRTHKTFKLIQSISNFPHISLRHN